MAGTHWWERVKATRYSDESWITHNRGNVTGEITKTGPREYTAYHNRGGRETFGTLTAAKNWMVNMDGIHYPEDDE